ncbi:MAG: arsenate reductase ArsC [Campylobacterales bacterium]|nr:arsenate reductase ArsC [Campylobacterales bacterium]
MAKKKVLFVCIKNSARSQMAEALMKKYYSDYFDVESSGFEPGIINKLAVEALKIDEEIDISSHSSQSVFELFKKGKVYNYVITVCDEASAEKCPVFPGLNYRIHWSFKDPASLEGTDEEKLAQTIAIKNDIKAKIDEFANLVISGKIRENIPKNWKIF